MGLISLPANGLPLAGVSGSSDRGDLSSIDSQPPQVMRLDLADGVLDDIIRASQHGKSIHLAFGKTITLQYGNKTQQILSIAQPTQSEYYTLASAGSNELQFAGLVTHKLAQRKVQESTAGADAALVALQSKMASHQQKKQSKQIKVIQDSSGPSTPIVRERHVQGRGSSKFFEQMKPKPKPKPSLSNSMTRSMPASPALGAIRPVQPATNPPTSAPTVQDEKSQKLQALKVPLLHLVAIRPMSLKFLAQKISCSQDECKQVLEKIGKPARLDPTKWDLIDKAFKELDVWKFDYESDNDRELAIEHTISAYDRLRLSREDRLWQLLLPKGERDKGKILSKLQLHQGPIQKSGTPRIHVQRTAEESGNGNVTGTESDRKDRLAPNDAEPMARSKSSDQIKKQRVSEKEAQSKRLLSKNPRKLAPAAKPREAPKKAAKKGGSSGPVVKSTEFVHDSDEDDEDENSNTFAARDAGSKALEATAKKPPKSLVVSQNESTGELSKAEKDVKQVKHPGKATSSPRSTSPGSKHRLSDASHSSSSASKLSRQRTTSSPLKPSPLGSSPPTNASDLDNDSQLQHTSTSSTSSTPLISQNRKAPVSLKLADAGAKDSSPMPHNTFKHSLKRKANDLDSDIHAQNVAVTNGHSHPAAKRARTSATSTHCCPNSSSSASDMSPADDNESILAKAERFKEYYAVYERLHREINMQPEGAPSDKIDKVNQMHTRLVSMKDEIARAVMTS